MMNKLMLHIIDLLIGHKGRVLIFCTLLLLPSCGLFNWDNEGDYWYLVKFKNNTNDTLTLVLGGQIVTDSLLLIPYTIIDYQGREVYKGDDVIRDVLFNEAERSFQERARIFRNNILLVDWEGPAREMPDSIHHFYNFNSWESWLTEENNNGIVQFTINDSDFE